jgi:hypothetical protein
MLGRDRTEKVEVRIAHSRRAENIYMRESRGAGSGDT